MELRKHVEGRIAGMEIERYSWWVHWLELSKVLLPRRYRWFIAPNQVNRGSPINSAIIDSTGVIAARTCASGMMAGITSPTQPWFKLNISGFTPIDIGSEGSKWLSECESRVNRVLSESNFYSAVATHWYDLVVFGTAAMIEYEDFEDVVHFTNPCLGEFYVANDKKGHPGAFARKFVLTVEQLVAEYGIDAVTESTRTAFRNGSASLALEKVVCHVIEPNTDGKGPKGFTHREVYWEEGSARENILRTRGFNEWPCAISRWDLQGNDAYGRSPGMDALPDVLQLQQEQKRKAQAIDKMVNPPLKADAQLRNQPASLLPGGVTYLQGANNIGIEPIFQMNFPVREIMEDIMMVQDRIRTIFFNDLFLMISQLQTVRTASEIDARREEKLVMLGPVLERIESETLAPVIKRTFNIMERAGLIPPRPAELGKGEVEIKFTSMLAEAQRAASTTSMERLAAQAGSLAAVDPSVLDTVNMDQFMSEYASRLGTPPKVVRSNEEILALREERAKAQQQQAALQQTDAAVKGAETMSKTDVGGGQNALQAILGGI